MMIINFVALIGKAFLKFLDNIGVVATFLFNFLVKGFLPPYYIKNFFYQVVEIAFFSLPVVGLTAVFTGMVLALQSFTSFTSLPSEGIIANIVAVSLTRELAPVLTSLMISGRISSSIAAEIATMKVTEQTDALYILSINYIKFLITPRVLAGIICLPFLVFLSDIIGIMGGYIVAVLKLNFNGVSYIKSSYDFVTFYDVYTGLLKGAIFGFILTFIGCYFGYNCEKGAGGVGKATTYAVVTSSILIFLADYFLTVFFFGVR